MGFRLVVGQSPGELVGRAARLDWLAALLDGLGDRGGDLVLLPELFLTGYNVGPRIEDLAEPADGPSASEVSGLARRHGVAICYGYAERTGDTVHNAAQCFGPDGARLGGHRKLVLPPGFETAQFTPGAGCEVFCHGGLRIGILICYDAEFPETARSLARAGADLILVPTALGAQWEWVSRTLIPARAYENGVYLAYANHAGVENGLAYLGQSFIAAPDGAELARSRSGLGVLTADLDLARIGEARRRLPYHRDLGRLILSDNRNGQGDRS